MAETKKETIKKKPRKAEPKKTTPKTKTRKTASVSEPVVKKSEKVEEGDGHYFEAVGRRKSAVARIRLFTKGEKEFVVNDKKMEEYFPTLELRELCSSALKKMKCFDKFRTVAKVNGGGVNAQAEAIRHGTARALFLFNPDFKKRLRKVGYLTRDQRQRERKKFGLKRARRAPQWKKR